MCGILFSQNNSNIKDLDLDLLKRRGPEGFKDYVNPYGYFAHSLLNTIGEKVIQPFETKHGILLYNGSTYNSRGKNDTKWIGNQLDSNLSNTVELIRSLRGEYALIYVTDKHIVFCADQFFQRNLWFYYNQNDKIISICSLPNIVANKHGAVWQAEENKIYVIDKQTFKLDIIKNYEWNLDQTVNHYDFVFEKFESAIKDRHETAITTYLLSSGVDSGLVNCAAIKFFKKVKSVCDINGEDRDIIAQRLKLNPGKVTIYTGEQQEKAEIFNKILSSDIFLQRETDPLIHIVKNFVSKNNNKVLITGNGGDEIYNDYQEQLYGYKRGRSNGKFPDNLSLIWPWHNHRPRLLNANSRFDFITGYFGAETRNPLLDRSLVQAWLNTTSKLKNKSYKDWMEIYLKEANYPYALNKVHWNQPIHPNPDWAIKPSTSTASYWYGGGGEW